MPDELLCCPSCRGKVRLADEHFGCFLKCPLCGIVFQGPARLVPVAPPTGDGPPSAESLPNLAAALGNLSKSTPEAVGEVQETPAHRLLLVPGLMLLVQGVVALLTVIYPALEGPRYLADFWKDYFEADAARHYPAALVDFLRALPPIVLTGMSAFLAAGTVVGAVQLLRLRNYPLALISGVLVLGNIFYPGCQWFLNWFVGIWALRVLRLPAVRESFE